MAREPYDYRPERRLAAYVLTGLIAGQVGYDTVNRLPVDLGTLSLLGGMLFGVVGLGRLIRSIR